MNFWKCAFRTHVGKKLAEVRRSQNLTQEYVAERAQLDSKYLSEIERGLKMPTLDSIFRISYGLDLNPSDLIEQIEQNIRYE